MSSKITITYKAAIPKKIMHGIGKLLNCGAFIIEENSNNKITKTFINIREVIKIETETIK